VVWVGDLSAFGQGAHSQGEYGIGTWLIAVLVAFIGAGAHVVGSIVDRPRWLSVAGLLAWIAFGAWVFRGMY